MGDVGGAKDGLMGAFQLPSPKGTWTSDVARRKAVSSRSSTLSLPLGVSAYY